MCFINLLGGARAASGCSGWLGCCACCLSCDAWSLRWVSSGRICVSMCRCCALVSRVHPVAVLSAWFWIVWSFDMFVCEVMGAQIVLAYSRIGLVIVLYVVAIVSLDLPQCVVVSDLRMLMVCLVRFKVLVM